MGACCSSPGAAEPKATQQGALSGERSISLGDPGGPAALSRLSQAQPAGRAPPRISLESARSPKGSPPVPPSRPSLGAATAAGGSAPPRNLRPTLSEDSGAGSFTSAGSFTELPPAVTSASGAVYKPQRKIARGSAGITFYGICVSDGSPVVLKQVDKKILRKRMALGRQLSLSRGDTSAQQTPDWMVMWPELANMQALEHPNVVRLIDVVDLPGEADAITLILEYCPGGSIQNLLTPPDKPFEAPQQLPEAQAWGYFREAATGLDFLHERNILHRDLKPDNLLFGKDGRVKIADFGESVKFNRDRTTLIDYSGGTPAFMAPESLKDGEFHGRAADVWALGATLYTLLYGAPPFQGETVYEMYRAIQQEPLSFPPRSPPLSADCQSLLRAILVKDPAERPTLLTISEHAWFTKGGAERLQIRSTRDRGLSVMTAAGGDLSTLMPDATRRTLSKKRLSRGGSGKSDSGGPSATLGGGAANSPRDAIPIPGAPMGPLSEGDEEAAAAAAAPASTTDSGRKKSGFVKIDGGDYDVIPSQPPARRSGSQAARRASTNRSPMLQAIQQSPDPGSVSDGTSLSGAPPPLDLSALPGSASASASHPSSVSIQEAGAGDASSSAQSLRAASSVVSISGLVVGMTPDSTTSGGGGGCGPGPAGTQHDAALFASINDPAAAASLEAAMSQEEGEEEQGVGPGFEIGAAV